MLSANCHLPSSNDPLVAELFILLCADALRNPVLVERRSAVMGV
jgi:hypothetical protein